MRLSFVFVAAAGLAACAVSFPEVVGDGTGASSSGASGAGGSGGGASGTGGPSEGAGPEGGAGGTNNAKLCTWGDEFDAPAPGACWEDALNESSVDIDESMPGFLRVQPHSAGTAWWESQQGYYLYRTVVGSFAAVAQVTASDPEDDTQPPYSSGATYLMAGLLLRSEREYPWIKLEVGYRDDTAVFQGEPVGVLGGVGIDASTSHQLQPQATAQLGHTGFIGICRDTDSLYLYTKLDGEDWEPRADTMMEVTNVDVPDSIQLGLIAGWYTGTALQGRTEGRFDFVRVREYGDEPPITNGTDCAEVLEELISLASENTCDCD